MPSKEPKNLDDMKADPKMLAAALIHAKATHVDENILFYFDKGNAQALYPKYIDPGCAGEGRPGLIGPCPRGGVSRNSELQASLGGFRLAASHSCT